MHKLSMNENAIVSIDLMVAIILVMMAVIMAIQMLPAISHEDRDWRLKQYMAATRASDNLVQDMGAPLNWDTKWNATLPDYKNVTKIGLVDDSSLPNVLNLTKINVLMGPGYPNTGTGTTLYWWEFPPNFTTSTQAARDNASRALGLTGYNFYMQLHPVLDNSTFNSTNLTNRILALPINKDMATVIDRYVYIRNVSVDCEYVCYYNSTLKKDLSVHYRLNLWVWQ